MAAHMNVLAGADFFTVEVLKWRRLVTYYVLFFLHLETRRITIAGITRDSETGPIRAGAGFWPVRIADHTPIDAEVIRVAKRSLRPTPPAFLEVLLQIEVLILNVQALVDALPNHARAELPRRLFSHHPIEDLMHAIRPPQIQVVTNDLFEEFASAQRSIEDLGQAYFHLPDRQTPLVTGSAVLWPQRQREPLEPFAEQPVKSMSSNPSELQICCSISGSSQERKPLSRASFEISPFPAARASIFTISVHHPTRSDRDSFYFVHGNCIGSPVVKPSCFRVSMPSQALRNYQSSAVGEIGRK